MKDNKIKMEQSITHKILIDNGFEEDFTLSKIEGHEMHRMFHKNINNEWYISFTYLLTNSISRDWCCHIDNSRHESIAFADIQTIEHFNKFMDLMDVDYRL